MLYALSIDHFEESWIPSPVHLIIEGIGAQSHARGQAASLASPGAKDIKSDH
jgi:hypothetical protein